MYEWPRSDFATFRKLDLNHDGFLTPQELTPTSSGKLAAPAAAVNQYPPEATATIATTAKSAEAPADTEAAPVESTGAQRSEAERFFELLDKDKNDKVTEEEFKKSFLMSKKFADAGISLSFPVTRDEFIRQYPQPAGK
jgi:Ca2+-binding EF-hand superfamily protein